jgi:TRAP transporter TAXI family solute receptor
MSRAVVFVLLAALTVTGVFAGGGTDKKTGGTEAAGSRGVLKYSVGTSSVGVLMYVMGSGWANIINAKVPDKFFLTAETTTGNVQNLAMLESGEIELTTNGVMTVEEAYGGKAAWTQGKAFVKARAVFPLNVMLLTAITIKGTGIQTLSDLTGKIVGLGNKGGAVDGVIQTVFAEQGIKPRQIHNDGHAATISALSDGQIDAFITFQMAPAPTIVELQASREVVFIKFSPGDLATIGRIIPSMVQNVIPANSYKGVAEDIPTMSDNSLVITSADIADDIVYDLVKTTFENIDELRQLHASIKDLGPERVKDIRIPFHPGARKYYEEIGITLPVPTVVPPGYKQ